jgi:hypothetical protein
VKNPKNGYFCHQKPRISTSNLWLLIARALFTHVPILRFSAFFQRSKKVDFGSKSMFFRNQPFLDHFLVSFFVIFCTKKRTPKNDTISAKKWYPLIRHFLNVRYLCNKCKISKNECNLWPFLGVFSLSFLRSLLGSFLDPFWVNPSK